VCEICAHKYWSSYPHLCSSMVPTNSPNIYQIRH